MKFPATLVQVAGKPPFPASVKQGKFFSGSMHFMEFPATLIQVAEKLPPPHLHGPSGETFFLQEDAFVKKNNEN